MGKLSEAPETCGTCGQTLPKCKRCGGFGYLVGDAEWVPYAIRCDACRGTGAPTPGSDGWQMVPKEPTPEMIVAARLIPATPLWDQSTLYLWQAMLAAAPPEPEETSHE